MSDPTDRDWLRVIAGDATTFEYRRGGIRLLPYRARIEFRLVPPKKRRPLPVFAFDSLRVRRLLGRAIVILVILLISLMGVAAALYMHKENLEVENGTKDIDIDRLKTALNTTQQVAAREVEELQVKVTALQRSQKNEMDIEVARQVTAILASRNVVAKDKPAPVTKAQVTPPPVQAQAISETVPAAVLPQKVEIDKSAELANKALPPAVPQAELRPQDTTRRAESAILSKDRLGLAVINKNSVTTVAGNELKIGDILPTGERMLEIRQNGEIVTDKRTILVLP